MRGISRWEWALAAVIFFLVVVPILSYEGAALAVSLGLPPLAEIAFAAAAIGSVVWLLNFAERLGRTGAETEAEVKYQKLLANYQELLDSWPADDDTRPPPESER